MSVDLFYSNRNIAFVSGGEVQMVNAHERQLMDMYKSYKVKLNFTPMNKNLIGLSQSIM